MNSSSKSYTRLTPQETSERLQDAPEDLILLDVRTPQEWRFDGYIEGAILIPTFNLVQRAPEELPKDAEIIVYCAHGQRSANVAAYLVHNGYAKVYDVAGGIDAWARSGLPVQRDS